MTKYFAPIEAVRFAGINLYGERWLTPLARALAPHNPRHPRGLPVANLWAMHRGTQPVPAWIPAALVVVAREEASRATENLELVEHVVKNWLTGQ